MIRYQYTGTNAIFLILYSEVIDAIVVAMDSLITALE